MSRLIVRSLLATALIATPLVAQQAAPPTTPASPVVGEMAPDFTMPHAGKDGVAAEPVTLSKLRGKVVVLAFYPQDRTSGCTAEMTRFRDKYTELFGEGVVVLPISKDGLESHASWAKEMNMPFTLVSDTAGTVARAYSSQRAPGAGFTRNIFVIGKDGKVMYASRLNALSEDAYTVLGSAVAEAKK